MVSLSVGSLCEVSASEDGRLFVESFYQPRHACSHSFLPDIYDDLITRTAEGSDAVACHNLIPCCLPRCVGVQFWLVAFCFQVIGLYLGLVWLVSNN